MNYKFIKDFLKKFFYVANDKKKDFSLLCLLIFFGALLEVLSIGLFIPALEYFNNQEQTLPWLSNLNFFENIFNNNFIVFILFCICGAFLIKFFYFVFLFYYKNRFLVDLNTKISSKLFKNIVYKPYNYFIKQTTPNLMNIIGSVDGFTFGIAYSLILITIDILTLILLLIFLLSFNFKATFFILFFLVFISLIYNFLFKKKIEKSAEEKFLYTGLALKHQQDCFNGIKEVKLYQAEDYFVRKFRQANFLKIKNSLKEDFIKSVPKFLFELLFVFLFSFFIFFSLNKGFEISKTQVILGVFVIASYKLAPLINRLLNSFQSIKFKIFSFNKFFDEMKDGLSSELFISDEKIDYSKNIELRNIDFKYPEKDSYVIKNLNLSLNFGNFIGIYGQSGSGKSTLLNIICGLLKSNKGEVIIDDKILKTYNKDWINQIGYVPQKIHITSDTLAENIAYGKKKSEIDLNHLKKILEMTNLKSLVDSLNNGVNTLISEAGRNISGGQAQRIGIARGLYKNPKILILDESTSNLDYKTEEEILKTIKNFKGKLTVIFVSHRMQTLKYCDEIYELENSNLLKK